MTKHEQSKGIKADVKLVLHYEKNVAVDRKWFMDRLGNRGIVEWIRVCNLLGFNPTDTIKLRINAAQTVEPTEKLNVPDGFDANTITNKEVESILARPTTSVDYQET